MSQEDYVNKEAQKIDKTITIKKRTFIGSLLLALGIGSGIGYGASEGINTHKEKTNDGRVSIISAENYEILVSDFHNAIKKYDHYKKEKESYEELFVAIKNIETLNQINEIESMFKKLEESLSSYINYNLDSTEMKNLYNNKYKSKFKDFRKKTIPFLTKKLSEDTKNES